MSLASVRSKSRLIFISVTACALALGFSGCTKKPAESPNTLHLFSIAKIKGLDPAQADDLYADTEINRVYDGLYQYAFLKRPYTLEPNLAEAMPEISADRKTYTIKIKKGVLFQDDASFKATNGKGRELTSDDVVFSFKRLADPKVASVGWWIFDGKIAGLNDWRDAASKTGTADYAAAVEGLKAVDRYTVQIKLKDPSYQFIYALQMPFTHIVPKEAVDAYGKEFINHAVGTGPYRVEEYNPNSKIIYVRNPTYRHEVYPSEGEPGDKEKGLLEDAGKTIPFVDRVVVTIFEESQPQWLNFLAGKLDYSTVPKDNFDATMKPGSKDELNDEMKKKGLSLQVYTDLDVTHETFNMADPVLGKNKLLRQALSMALDPKPLIDLFYNGRALPAQGPIPPGLSGYDPNLKNPYRQYNLEKAKELLKQAGYPDGKGLAPIEYVTLSDSTSRQMNDYLAKAFTALGVSLKMNTYSWPEFQAAVKNKKGQMWGFAWGADYPDAENFFQLFYSKNVSPGPNDANYTNPEYDKLYEKALTLPDAPERTALYQQMAKLLVEECPWIFNAHRLIYHVVQPWVKNYKYSTVEKNRFKYVRLDPTLKK